MLQSFNEICYKNAGGNAFTRVAIKKQRAVTPEIIEIIEIPIFMHTFIVPITMLPSFIEIRWKV